MQNDVLSTILNQHDIQVDGSPEKVSAYFEELVFTKSKMKEYLSKDLSKLQPSSFKCKQLRNLHRIPSSITCL